MKKMIVVVLFLGVIGATSSWASETVAEGTPAEPSKWSKAGGEIGEAAHAVGDATADSSKKAWQATKEGSEDTWDATKEGSKEAWEATKEGSTEAWDKTKSKSKELWEKGKAKVHDATESDTTTEQEPNPESVKNQQADLSR